MAFLCLAIANTSSSSYFQANARPLDRAHHEQGWGGSGMDPKADKQQYDAKATKVFKSSKAAKSTKVLGKSSKAKTSKGEPVASGAEVDASGESNLFSHNAAAATRGVGCVKKALAADYLLDRVSSLYFMFDLRLTI